ncbi:MAG TPA: thiamine pyrophosphate-dependent enzyme [Paenalcaligenes sp.]|nr:thiamine pyrophosphate-dependent enzyme [Paenalcaligenes sp.]
MQTYRAADLLVDTLIQQDIRRVFCVPGESYLSVLDAFTNQSTIEVVTARHEGGAGFMAVTEAKMGPRPGICFVSRGPGAMNAAIALHTAQQDALPLIMFVGQVARADLGRNAFQEVDYVSQWGQAAKWVWEVNDASQLAEVVDRAFQLAQSPTPGPVIISLPEDMLSDQVPQRTPRALIEAQLPGCTDASVTAAHDLLSRAQKPLIIAGQSLNHPAGRAALQALATQHQIPVAVSFRQQDLFPNDHDHYAGHLVFNAPKQLVDILSETDLILALGTRLGDVTSQGYTLPRAPQPAQPLIHVYPDPNELGRNFATDLGVAADPTEFCNQLAALPSTRSDARDNWRREAHEKVHTLYAWQPQQADDGVVFGNVVAAVNDLAAEDAIICVDAGNFSSWVQRIFNFTAERRMLATISGAMGSAIPAAVASSLRHPQRQVIAFVGDGGFMMTGNELATAQQYGANIKVIVSDNRSLATIRLHQELQYPDRVSATQLQNPDFVTLAQAHQMAGYRIDNEADIKPILSEALTAPGSAVIAVNSSMEYIAAFATLKKIRSQTP